MKAWRNSAPAAASHSDKQPTQTIQGPKSIKNEGRSGKVYENKGSMDKMTEATSDICARSKPFLQKNSDFEAQSPRSCAFETRFVRLRTAQVRASIVPRQPGTSMEVEAWLALQRAASNSFHGSRRLEIKYAGTSGDVCENTAGPKSVLHDVEQSPRVAARPDDVKNEGASGDMYENKEGVKWPPRSGVQVRKDRRKTCECQI